MGALPILLIHLARDQATTDRWAAAEATYDEAIQLARETGQRTELAFGLAGLAWLQARQGREAGLPAARRRGAGAVRRSSASASTRSGRSRRSGDLELGLGRPGRGARAPRGSCEPRCVERGIARRRPVPGARAGRRATCASATRRGDAAAVAARAGRGRGQGPAVVAGAGARCRGLLAPDASSTVLRARRCGCTRRRPTRSRRPARSWPTASGCGATRQRVRAREQLRAALDAFERLGARPWAERARRRAGRDRRDARGAATRARSTSSPRRSCRSRVLLAAGTTTREAAARAVPQPEDDRVPPAPRLPEARHPLARGAGRGAGRRYRVRRGSVIFESGGNEL